MNYFQRTLPSLDALVFFEAAARLENFTRAAQELNVSQVAVSKRIRILEEDLGVVLFQRQGRSLRLTEAGRSFANRIQAGLAFLEDSVSKVREAPIGQRRVIKIAANENVHFFWLAPLIRAFQIAGNDAVVSVLTANNVTDVLQADTDLAIFHGRSVPDGWSSNVLFDETVAPVAAPSFLASMGENSDLPVTLLDYHIEAPEWVNWGALSEQTEIWFRGVDTCQCSSYIQSISRAMAGNGLAIGVLPLLQRELAAGSLEIAIQPSIQTGRKYFLSTPMWRHSSTTTQELMTFLMANHNSS